jgi:hypothetical protein
MVRYPSGAVGNVLTTNDGQEATGLYSDGRRRAIHSYNKPVYVPGLGPCIATQGNTSWTAGGGTNDFLILNEATGEMTAGAANPEPATSSGSGSCYDPSRHAVWYKGAATGSFVKYDVDGDSWATVGSASSSSNYSSLCYLPDDDCILWGNDFLTQKYAVFDCATGTLYTPTFSGTPAGSLRQGHSQPRWVPELGAACAWDNSTDTTAITRFTPGANPRTDPWSIDTLSVDGANAVTPSARAAAGTYGRFIYATNLGGFVLFNSTSGPIYFFKVL